MTDIRRVAEPRTEIVTLKLTTAEHASLKQLAQESYRSAGDQLRFLLAEAVKAAAGSTVNI